MGQGVGEGLLLEMRQRLETAGYAWVELSVYLDHRRAAALYHRLDGRPIRPAGLAATSPSYWVGNPRSPSPETSAQLTRGFIHDRRRVRLAVTADRVAQLVFEPPPAGRERARVNLFTLVNNCAHVR